MTSLRDIRAREARDDARARTCQECGAPAEVWRPDPDHDGEQVGYCGLCESAMPEEA